MPPGSGGAQHSHQDGGQSPSRTEGVGLTPSRMGVLITATRMRGLEGWGSLSHQDGDHSLPAGWGSLPQQNGDHSPSGMGLTLQRDGGHSLPAGWGSLSQRDGGHSLQRDGGHSSGMGGRSPSGMGVTHFPIWGCLCSPPSSRRRTSSW